MITPIPDSELYPLILRDAFLNIQLFPLSPNTAYYAAEAFGVYDMLVPSVLLAVVLFINALCYYALGRLIAYGFARAGWLARLKFYTRGQKMAYSWGKYLLVFIFTPIGMLLALAGGFLKLDIRTTSLLMLVGGVLYSLQVL